MRFLRRPRPRPYLLPALDKATDRLIADLKKQAAAGRNPRRPTDPEHQPVREEPKS